MVAWLEENSQVEFLISLPSSDWYPNVPGAVNFGRVLSPKEYDGKKLGAHFAELRPAREEFNAPGRSEEHTSELQSLMRSSYAVFCLTQKNHTPNPPPPPPHPPPPPPPHPHPPPP